MTDRDRLATALADRYRVERELGQGGMATVYLAEDVRHHRKVALKMLRPELAATLGVERFLREIEVAANLQHPHILPLFDSGEAQGFLFYVMPYIEGESLRAKLERGGELSVAESAKILRDVVDALAYAHQQGVVHRDIKPDNVLLSGRHALVTDFGVAKAVSEATGRQALTTAGVALGTPAYMAPEQAVADPHVDSRADLYAVGVMAYEMLTGHPPFTGPSPQAILAAHVTEPATPIATIRQSVPAPLAQLVMQCLEKRPADRPASAEIVLPQLEALATPSGGITPTSTAPLTAVVVARRRVPRWAIGVVVAAVVTGGGYALVRALHAGAGAPAQSVAVLPFENVGGDSTNQAFTDGVQDEILTDLTRIATLQVTSRTSVQEYRNSRKSVKQIGAELGVATLLEGQVQRAGNQVHVNVQLVDAARDRQVWANSYDRELTAENVFAMQGDIAQNVAHALQVSLTPSQEAALEKPPTANLEALDWYHRGRALFSARGGTLQDTAITRAFERAVALDSNFAEAWAGLATSRSWAVRDGLISDTLPARLALSRAIRLRPSSPEIEIAQAYFAYYAKGNYDDALAHFRAVAADRPGDVEAVRGIGYILRRHGQWDQALDAEQRVIALDPRDPGARWDLGESYEMLKQFDRAEQEFRRALILDPTYGAAAGALLDAIIAGQGDTARGRAALDSLPPAALLEVGAAYRSVLARWGRHYDAADAAADSVPLVRLIDRINMQIAHALNAVAAGATARARLYADSAARLARGYLQQAHADVFGNVADFHTALGFAEAIEGRATEAIADGERAVALNPVSRDVVEGARSVEGLIEIHALLGHRDEFLRLLTEQARSPYSLQGVLPISRAVIRLDPLFDAVRKDPRVKALLANDAAWVVR
jgi:TolB-like protein/tetratricopeptide (TPR) repeat protein/tRNA A-37 threonylcarbamoyl transferase component Bud32